eukprot:14938557-Alexandrium_andersonii.AAC.1
MAFASPGDASASRLRAVARSWELNAEVLSRRATANPSVSAKIWVALAMASAPPATPTANWRGRKVSRQHPLPTRLAWTRPSGRPRPRPKGSLA